jgi:hypothetical protein
MSLQSVRNIGAPATGDAQGRLRLPPQRELQQLQPVNRDLSCLSLHSNAFAGQVVEPLALMVQRRDHRRHLLYLADKSGKRLTKRRFGQRRGISLFSGLSTGILGIGSTSKPTDGPIDLWLGVYIRQQPGPLPHGDHQHPGGIRVQCTCMSYSLLLKQALAPSHDIETGHARRFRDVDKSIH